MKTTLMKKLIADYTQRKPETIQFMTFYLAILRFSAWFMKNMSIKKKKKDNIN
jgi:hypothetical protein